MLLPCPEKFLVVDLYSGIILFEKHSILNDFQCPEYVCLDNCSGICTVTLCYVLHQTHWEFWHIRLSVSFSYLPAYSVIFSVIEVYSCILRHYSGIHSFIQAYSVPCVTPCIFTNFPYSVLIAYSEPEPYLKPCERLAKHIQNPAIGHYSAIFSHIQNLIQRLQMQKPDILRILEYSESFHNCILMHIQSPVIFTKI